VSDKLDDELQKVTCEICGLNFISMLFKQGIASLRENKQSSEEEIQMYEDYCNSLIIQESLKVLNQLKVSNT
jgi:hypothetical protein